MEFMCIIIYSSKYHFKLLEEIFKFYFIQECTRLLLILCSSVDIVKVHEFHNFTGSRITTFSSQIPFLSPFVSSLGEPVDINDLQDTLKDMKIEFTDKEYLRLMRDLRLDGKHMDVY